jgi:hypothetical protein
MKKLLVLLAVAALVLSLATVSMGATIKGDFRYEFTQDETNTANESFPLTDLRFTVSGDLSESLSATGVFQLKHDGKKNFAGPSVDNSGSSPKYVAGSSSFDMNEYYVTYKESWGGVKAGYYEYKFTPSRALLKTAGGNHVWSKVDVMAATTINLPVDGLSADVLFQPYAQEKSDDGGYGVSVAYAADNWGAKVTYADYKGAKEVDLTAFDVYYQITKDIKVFVLGADYSGIDTKILDGMDPVLGVEWKNMFGSKVSTTWEYALEARTDTSSTTAATGEYNEYAFGLKYTFNNKTALEIEHQFPTFGADALRTIYRLRYQF